MYIAQWFFLHLYYEYYFMCYYLHVLLIHNINNKIVKIWRFWIVILILEYFFYSLNIGCTFKVIFIEYEESGSLFQKSLFTIIQNSLHIILKWFE